MSSTFLSFLLYQVYQVLDTLLARILCRGVIAGDLRVLAFFSPSASSVEQKGTSNGSAA